MDEIVKLVPAVRADTDTDPAPPLVFCGVNIILLLAVTAVVLTTTVPPTIVDTPIFAFVPSFMLMPFPTVCKAT